LHTPLRLKLTWRCNAGILYISTYTNICLKASFSIDTVISISLLKVEIHFVIEWRDGKPALILENIHHGEDEDSELNFLIKN
jgi:hypothetical protein